METMIISEMPVQIQNAAQRERLFTALYEKAFPAVAAFVSNRNGTIQDAKDIFQDALVIFYEKTVADKMIITGSDESYLLGIAKHLWLRKFSRDKKSFRLTDIESAITIPD